MKKKLVYICSPCRGDYEKNLQNARDYCRDVITKWPDVLPIAPHIYFTQFLNDTIQSERSLGLLAGLTLLEMCDEVWVFAYDEPSEGMQAEIDYAKEQGLPIRDGFKLCKAMELLEEEMGPDLLVLPRKELAGINCLEVKFPDDKEIKELEEMLKANRNKKISRR